MDNVLVEIQELGIVPVVVLNDVKDAKPLAKALCDGGLPCAEVTFCTDAAEESIRTMANAYPEMVIGAGTVLTTEQVDRAVAAGAKFIVSPGLNPTVVKYCISKNIPITPGVTCPSQIEQAIELGLDTVQFFPAQAAGGITMLKSIAAPYANMKFIPRGGIDTTNLLEYLACDQVIACGGNWMVKEELIKSQEFDKITELVKETVSLMHGFEIKHVGINCSNEEEADDVANTFKTLFGFKKKVGNSSIFAGTAVEVMKKPFLGANGHIAISTNSVDRAAAFLRKQGVEFLMDTAKYKNGKMTVVYLKDEVGGFAVHLVQK